MKNSSNGQHKSSQSTQNNRTQPPKKAIIICSVLFVIVTIILTAVIIIAQHPLAQIMFKMARHESYHMDITVSGIPFFGSINIQRSVDEDISYTSGSLLTNEHYSHVVGDKKYTYNKTSNGTWTVTESNKDDSSTSELVEKFSELLDPEKYEKVDGEKYTYKQKEDVTFENFQDVVIVVTEDTVTITMYFIMDGFGFPTQIILSSIGEVELTLPEV